MLYVYTVRSKDGASVETYRNLGDAILNSVKYLDEFTTRILERDCNNDIVFCTLTSKHESVVLLIERTELQ